MKECIPRGKVKKGEVLFAVVFRTKVNLIVVMMRELILTVRSLCNAQKQPLGTRVFGPVSRELRGEMFMRIISWP